MHLKSFPSISGPSFVNRRCLAVEFTGDVVRAALARSTGGRKELLDFTTIGVPDTGDDLPGIPVLQEIRQRLNVKAGTQAVFVSPLARSVILNMNRDRVMKMPRHLLMEAVKWEAEIYSGVPGYQALAGAEVEKKKIEPGQVLEEEEDVIVHVSVMERNIHQAAKERFRLAGLKLTRVYSPEVCFHVPLLEMHEASNRGVLEIGSTTSGLALLRGGETLSINTMNITLHMIREHLDGRVVPDLEDTLRQSLRQSPAPHPVAVTGAGALDHEIIRFLRGLSPNGVEPLLLRRAAGLTAAGEEESPAMAAAAGAAFRELGKRDGRFIGISDALPARVRISRSIYLMPVAATSLVFLLLLGHNLLMRYQEGHFNREREVVEARLSERREEQAQVKRLKDEIKSVESQITTISSRIDYIQQDWDKPLRGKIRVYQGLHSLLPETVALSRVQQDARDPNRFVINGVAVSAAEVLEFALRLQKENVAGSVEVHRLDRQQAARDKGVSHRFVMYLEAADQ